METILNIQQSWSSFSALTALVPASNVWLDLAADGAIMPYVVLHQDHVDYNFTFTSSYIAYVHFSVIAYAPTLAQVNAIQAEVRASFQCVNLTPTGFACYLTNETFEAEHGGAYKGTTSWRLLETE